MTLYDALDDVKRSRGDPRLFSGERRSTTGLFSGLDDRLVHVAPDGSLRDYSAPLSGLAGIGRSRFGLERDGDVSWFEGATQRYLDGTAIVETRHEGDDYACRQYDLTLGRVHLTQFVLEEPTATDARLRACVEFAPDGQANRIGQLRHDDAVEVHHRDERDVLAASTELSTRGHPPVRFEEVLADEPTSFPRAEGDDRYEEDRLSPITVADVELSGGEPTATIATVLSTDDRQEVLEQARRDAAEFADHEALLEAGRRQARDRLPAETPVDGVVADLRALSLLRAPSGARIAGPEFDPFYRHSGGYGYTWFRDDAEIAGFLLAADRRAGLGLDEWHAASARFYVETQLEDGTWPHRVWPDDGTLAPGWAHGRLEDGDAVDYQADQTASVAAYLATYLREVDSDDERVREAVRAALEGLDDSLADDGLPERVQNAWENMTGRFTHTAATFLEAYAAIARAPLGDDVTARARDGAQAVYEGLDALWVPDRGCYALRLDEGELDDRLDGSTLALASAHREYAAIGTVDEDRLERLVSHFETTIEGLYRDPEGPIEGLARFEDDPWRRSDQDAPKVWTVTTAWGAHASAELWELLAESGHDAAPTFDARARALLELVAPGGPLRSDGEYLPEQFFDDGTPDSATPLGWPHAIRLATATALAAETPSEPTVPDVDGA